MKRLCWILLAISLFISGCDIKKMPYLEQPIEIDYQQKVEQAKQRIIRSNNTLENLLEVHYIDVGQGDSTFIKTPNNKTILIDCGDNYNGDEIVDYIKGLGHDSIDVLITTHPDADHIGGCDFVMQNLSVSYVFDNSQTKDTRSYRDYFALANENNYQVLKSDSELEIDPEIDIDLFVIYDEIGFHEDLNENSIIVMLQYQDTSFLFTGDCGHDCEKQISLTENLDVDILKVGHHGSRHSTSTFFLHETTPGLAVISSDGGKKYGHPHAETLENLNNFNISILGTYDQGNIKINSDGSNYLIINQNDLNTSH